MKRFFTPDWGPWHFVGFGAAVGAMLYAWKITVAVLGAALTLYAFGRLSRWVLSSLFGD